MVIKFYTQVNVFQPDGTSENTLCEEFTREQNRIDLSRLLVQPLGDGGVVFMSFW